MGKKVKHLRDELVRTFLLYALIPIFIVLALSGALAGIYWNSSIVERNHRLLDTAAHSVESLLTGSQAKASLAAEGCDIDRLYVDSEYKVEVYKQLYEVKHSLEAECDFYVFDAQRQVVLGSRKLDSGHFFATQSVSWGLIQRLSQNPAAAAYEFTEPVSSFGQTMDIVVGKAVVQQGRVTGYVIFLISGSRLLNDIANPYVDIVVSDSFDYVPVCTNTLFCNNLRKLRDDFRLADGYFAAPSGKFYASQCAAMNGELTIYSFTSLSGIIDKLSFGIVMLIMALCLLCMLVVFGIREQAADKTKMLDRIVEGFAAVEDGQLDKRLNIEADNELKLIGDAYNRMLDSLQLLMKNNEEKARETVISEIKQLESQFNPHFLFNTLENIKYMIKLNPDAAGRMVLSLSRLLRYSIDNLSPAEGVQLREDMQYLNSYLDIQKLRFGVRLNYAVEVDEALYDCMVPRLFLQPLVENAVKYGFQVQESLFIDISIQRLEEQLYIKVYDNGCGLSAEELQRLNDSLKEPHNQTKHSGLYNLNRRIKLMYGGSYGLELVKNEPSGLTVYMILPYRKGEVRIC